MKKLSLLYTAGLAALAIFTTSCSDDDTTEITAAGPSINFVAASEVNETVNLTDTISFQLITAKGDKNMDELTFRVNAAGLAEGRILVDGEALDIASTYSIPNSEDAGATYAIQIVANTVFGTENIQIAVSDNDGLTSSVSVSLTTEEVVTTTDLAAAVDFSVKGPTGTTQDAATLEAALITYASNVDGSTGKIEGSSDAVNFVAASGTYTTVEDLETAYTAGTPVSSFNVSNGALTSSYIAFDGTDYVLINLTNFELNNGDNTLTGSYQK